MDKKNSISCPDTRNDITTLAFYDRHGSDSILSPQCNRWKVIHFPTHNMGLQCLLLNILQYILFDHLSNI